MQVPGIQDLENYAVTLAAESMAVGGGLFSHTHTNGHGPYLLITNYYTF